MMLFTMGLAIVSMSFVFPALGLADDSVASNEIPELDIASDRFDFAGDFPAAPGSPRTEELTWDDSRSEQFNQIWLDGDTTGGTEVILLPPASGDPLQTKVSVWDTGNVDYYERQNYTETGAERYFVNETVGYRLAFEAVEIDTESGIYEVQMTVRGEKDSGGWLSNVPVIGTVVDAGAATAATLGWLVEIAIWTVTYMFGLIATAVGLATDVVFYLMTLMAWLATTYTSIVAAAGSWTSVFVALPGILLSAILAKFIAIGVGLLPTT